MPFLMCLIAFFSLIFVFQFLQSSQFLFQEASSTKLILKMFSLLGVSYLPLLLPFSLIFGLLFGHGKLSSQSEFTALASFGISKFQMAQPAIFFSTLCLFTCFNSIHTWGPNAKFQARSLKYIIRQKIAATAFQPGIFLTQIPGITMYAESQNSKKELKNVFILDENEGRNLQVFSKKGEFVNNEAQGSTFGLKLLDGEIYNNSKKDLSSLVISFKSYLIELFTNRKAVKTNKKIGNSTSNQLKTQLLQSDTQKTLDISIELNKRNMFVLSCIFFLIVGSLFSIRLHNRSSKGSGFFWAIAISLFFWVMLFVAEFLSFSYKMPNLVYAPILPCSLFCIVSYWWIKFKSIN